MNSSSWAFRAAVAAIIVCSFAPLRGNPTGAQVVAGEVSLTPGGGGLTLTQRSGRAVINWQDFSIAAGEWTKFVQPDASSAVLNRVISGAPSALLGSLEANGKVFLINPNGVLVGGGARIDTAGFLASTLDVSDADFLAGGDLLFRGDSTAAVQNLGAINTLGGDVFLIARQVENSGAIRARNGSAGLAAGSEILLTTGGPERVFVRATSQPGQIVDRGAIEAATVELKAAGGNPYALAINHSGVIRATGSEVRDGQVWLVGTGGDVVTDGSIAATSRDGARGGEVRVLGERVALTDGARIDVSGTSEGGTALVGGDFQGKNAAVPNARATTIAAGASIRADGAKKGGRVIAWADERTSFAGEITTRGGGFVEVSGHGSLNFGGQVDTGGGTLLLDPTNITVRTGSIFNGGGSDLSDRLWAMGEGGDQIGVDNIRSALNGGSVILEASNGISWDANATLDYNGLGTGRTLTLRAYGDIIFNGQIRDSVAGGDSLGVVFNADRDASGHGAIKLNSGARVESNGGDIVFGGGSNPAAGTAYGTSGTAYRAVYLMGATVSSGAGNITMLGTGVNNAAGLGIGVDLVDNSIVESSTGSILINGYGGTGAGGTQLGISIFNGTQVRTTAGGSITMNGVAYANGTFNSGLNIAQNSVVQVQNGGNVTLTGTGAATSSGSENHGIYVQNGSSVLMTGSGNLALTGYAGAGSSGLATLTASNVIGNSTAANFTGNLTIAADWVALANATVSGAGQLTVQPTTVSQTIGLGDSASGGLNLTAAELGTIANGFSGLTFGHASGTGAVDVRTYAFKDPVTIRTPAGTANITVNGALSTGSAANAGTIALIASNNIAVATGGSITTQGQSVTLNSDRDNNTYGNISLVAGTSIATNGGNITLRGGSANLGALADPTVDASAFATEIAATAAQGAGAPGISLNGGTLNAGGGDIVGRAVGGTGYPGLWVANGSTVSTSGAGTIHLSGAGWTSGDNNDGIRVEGANSAITSANGAITLYGLGRGGASAQGVMMFGPGPTAPTISSTNGSIYLHGRSQGTGSNNQGVGLAQGAIVRTTGTGDVDVIGRTAGTSVDAHGIWLNTNVVTETTGSGALRFDGRTDGTGSDNVGVYLSSSSIARTTGSGDLEITGRSYGTGGGDYGVWVNASTVQTTGGGNLTITGYASPLGTLSNNEGVKIYGGSLVEVQTGTNRTLAINGTGGKGGSYNIGINNLGSTIRMGAAATGQMVMTGVGGAATGTGNWGVLVENNSAYESLGAASITLNGTGGTGSDNHGIKHSYGNTNRIGHANMTGDINLLADSIDLQSGSGVVSVIGKGALNIRPLSAGTTIGLGNSATGTLNLNATELSRLADGFSSINVGRTDGTGAIQVTAATFADALTLTNTGGNSGGIAVTGALNNGANSLTLASTGAVTQTAAITANALLLKGAGTFTLTNGGNSIGTMAATGAGPISLLTGGALSVGTVAGVNGISGGTSDVTLRTTLTNGHLTLAQPISVGGAGNITLASAGNFSNSAGASALTTGSGRWLVWSETPANDTRGGLTAAFKQYNATYGATPVAQPTGNGFLYRVSPTITPSLTGSVTKIYDGSTSVGLAASNFNFSGVLDGDTVTVTTASYGVYADKNVGSGKTVSASGLRIGSATNGSTAVYGYQLGSTTAAGAIGAITPATLTYTANSASRVYGDANPVLAGTVSGFVKGENADNATTGTLAFGSTAGASSNVGSYAITGSGLTANNGNYVFAQATGNATALAITPAPLTVSTSQASRTYGAANPAFTANLIGLRNGDSGNVVSGLVFSTGANATSNVGEYAVTPSGGSALNYALSYKPGTLVVNPAPLTITADDATRTYGAANPVFTASYSGFVNGETSAVVSGLGLASSATSGSNVGTYGIKPYGAAAANYAITFVPGTLTINKAPLTIAVVDETKIYGDANPVFELTFSSFVNGDTPGVISGLDAVTAATAASGVGTYAVTPTGTAANYEITHTAGTLTIDPAPLAVIANSFERTYAQANPEFTASFKGLVNGDDASAVSGLVFSTAANSESDSGGYPITVSGGTAANYTLTYYDGMLAIDKSLLVVTASDATRLYGAADPVFGATFDGFENGDDASAITGLTFATPANASSSTGRYKLVPTGGTATNYVLTYVPGIFSITPAPLTVTADNKSRTYGDANPELTASFSGLVNGDTAASLNGLYFKTGATAASNVGNYEVGVAGLRTKNYLVQYEAGTLTIDPAPLTIAADNATRRYGANNPAFTATYTGLVNGDAASVVNGLELTTAAVTNSNVGHYAISAANGSASNYTISYVAGDLNVTPAPLTITADDVSKIYGAALPAFTASFEGLVAGDTAASLGGTIAFTTAATASSNVGRYEVTPSGATSANYDITFNAGILTIDPAALTITAVNATRLYGASNPTFASNIVGLVNGDTAGALGTLTYATEAVQASDIGEYSVMSGGATTANYKVSYAPGTLTIDPAPLTITANNAARAFGEADPAFAVSYNGFVLGQNASVLSGSLGFETAAVVNSPIGSYAITPGGLASKNYDITFVDGLLSIGMGLLTVTANDASKLYGATLPTFTANFEGFTEADSIASLGGSLVFATSATAGSNVGTYTITPSGLTSANYNIVFVPGTLTIDPAALTITANNAVRLYGAANPTFGASIAGLVNGDAASVVSGLSLATTATNASNVGDYAINASGGAAQNYTLSYVPGTLTVNPAALTVTANNASRTYGAANPTFDASYNGFVLGQDASALAGALAFATAATTNSAVGQYAITPGGLSSSNYALTFVDGALNIGTALLTITANNASRVYGAANPLFSASFNGFIEGDSVASLGGSLAFTAGADTSSNVGLYAVTPSGLTSSNYEVVFAPGTLTIDPAALTITANDAVRLYGAANPTFGASFAGLVNGDAASVVSGLSFATTATNASNVGDYAINASGGAAQNYTLSYVPGTLTVNPAALTVTATNATRIYGAANPAFGASYNGFVLGQDASALGGALSFATTATPTSAVGQYAITPSGLSSSNYALTFVDGTLNIGTALLTVTANNASRVYGAANPAFSASFDGFLNGDSLASLGGSLAFDSVATATSPVGGYAIGVAGLTSGNYEIVFVPGTLAIDPAALTITALDASKLYGCAVTFHGTEFSATGLQNGETVGHVALTSAGAGSGAAVSDSPYSIVASHAAGGTFDGSNYAITYVDGSLVVAPTPLVITADSASKIYGQAVHFNGGEFTTTGLQNGETVGSVALVSGGARATAGVLGAPYSIVASAATGGTFNPANYSVTYVDGALAVTPAALSVVANNATRRYGAANPALGATYVGFVNGEDATVLGGVLSVTTPAKVGSGVGNYGITPTGLSATNYELTFVEGALAVTPAPLTIVANNASRAFGGANPAFTASYSGFVNDEDPSVLGGVLRFGTTAEAGSATGAYAISASGATSANYTINFVDGLLTIGTTRLTVTANDTARIYGAANPSFEATFDGFVGGDTPAALGGSLVFTTAATVGSNVGRYAVAPGGITSSNYELVFAPGVLTINPAALTIRANDATRLFGVANPAFAASYDGFVNGDSDSAVSGLFFDTTAASGSAVGDYPITPKGATADNYAIRFLPGTLKITAPVVAVDSTPAPVPTLNDEPMITPNYAVVVRGDSYVLVPVSGTTATGASVGQGVTGALTSVTTLPRNFEDAPAATVGGGVPTSAAGGQVVQVLGGATGSGSGGSFSLANVPSDQGLVRESSVSMGGFSVVYREAVDDVRQVGDANAAFSSSFSEFLESEKPQVVIVRGAQEQVRSDEAETASSGRARL